MIHTFINIQYFCVSLVLAQSIIFLINKASWLFNFIVTMFFV